MKRRRERVFEQAVYDLRTMIENGSVQPGDKLPPEPELSDQYEIGRSSVREAIRILEAEGLVEILRGKGTFVTGRDSWYSFRNSVIRLIKEHETELLHLLQAREGLEGIATYLAANKPTEELVRDLNQILDEMDVLANRQDSEIDFSEVARLNTEFHSEIGKASGNPLIHQLIVHLLETFAESNEAILYMGSAVRVQVHEHRQVVDAIARRQPQIAEKIMRQHIDRVMHEITDLKVDEPLQSEV